MMRTQHRLATCTSTRDVPRGSAVPMFGTLSMSKTDSKNKTYLYGIVLPNVRDKHPDVRSEQYEYDKNDVARTDLSGLPMLMNHADELCEVGHIAAFEPTSDGHACVLGVFDANADSNVAVFVRNALLGGHYDSLSLTHRFASYVKASHGDDRFHTRKTAIEVSVCAEPGRIGARVKEYLPSLHDLHNANRHFLSNFARNYRYPTPPEVADPKVYGAVNIHKAKSVPALLYYVDHTLHPLVERRLTKLFDQHGFIRASANHMSPQQVPQQPMQQQPGANTNTAQDAHTASTVPAPMNTETTQQTPAQSTNATPTGMAIDNTQAQPAPVVDTPSSSVNLLETPSETDSPSVVMAKFAAQNKALAAQLASYQQKEAAATAVAAAAAEKQQAEAAELEKQKASSFQTGAQSAVDIWAKALEAPPEELEQARTAMGGLVDLLSENGVGVDKMTDTLGALGEVMVRCSGRFVDHRAERDLSALQQQASALAREMSQRKSVATMSGGVLPPKIVDSGTVSANAAKRSRMEPPKTQQTTDASTSVSSGLTAFNPFGLPSNNALTAAQQTPVATGTVKASGTMMQKPGDAVDPLAQLTEENFYENVRAVYESLVKYDGEGNMEVPSLSEVAHGGIERHGVVKRNFDGREVEHIVERQRFKKAMAVGPQHLFPPAFVGMTAAYSDKRSDVNVDRLQTMSQLAAEVFPESKQTKRRADSGQPPVYSASFYWIDDQWTGSENIALPMTVQ